MMLNNIRCSSQALFVGLLNRQIALPQRGSSRISVMLGGVVNGVSCKLAASRCEVCRGPLPGLSRERGSDCLPPINALWVLRVLVVWSRGF